MPALNFKKQFAADVEKGIKRQTIRAHRKDCRNPQPGQTLYLYTGMRTLFCRKLKEAECLSVEQIYIGLGYDISLGSGEIDLAEENAIIAADGFKTRHEFFGFFETVHGLPFNGFLIKW